MTSLDFIDIETIKEAYVDRLTLVEELFHGDKFIKLHLIESEKEEGYAANWQRGQNDVMPKEKAAKLKRTPIDLADIFVPKSAKKKVRRVLVEGDAGTGKTIFCAKTAEDWANEEVLQNFELVLHFPLRDKEVASAKSVEDLIKYLDESVDTLSKEKERALNDEKVLIILDGWDELDESNRQEGSFMYKLVTRKHLPRASLLVTSRPSASAPLHKIRTIDRCIEIVGFSKEDVKEFIEVELADDEPQKAANLLEQLNKTPLLASLCSIPLNCAIICQLWRTSQDDQIPSTISGIYRNIILNIVLRDIHRKFPEYKETTPALKSFDSIPDNMKSLFWNLCEFAFYAIKKNQQLFSVEELPNQMKKDNFQFGLLQRADSRQSGVAGRVPSFHFLHLTFQEYLASLYLAKQPPNAKIRACRNYSKSKRFHMVWRFLFGISYAPSSVSSLIPPLSNTVVVFLLQMLMEKRALLCHCALEASNPEVYFEVAEALKGNYEAHTAHDCVAVASVLSEAKPSADLLINFDNSDLGDDGIVEVTKLLALNSTELEVSELSLRGNKLTSEGIVFLFSHAFKVFQSSLMVLDVSGNKINNVSTIITTLSSNMLSMLDLSGCPLGVSGIQSLVDVVRNEKLPNLSTLWLVKSLSSSPKVNAELLASLALYTKLRALDVSENHLSKLELQTLAHTLSLIARDTDRAITLGLRRVMLELLGMKVFIDKLVGVINFEFLSIEDNSICSDSLSLLADCVRGGIVRIKSLFLDGNPIGLHGVLPLSQLICSNECDVEAYSIKKCHLTDFSDRFDSKESPQLTAEMVCNQLQQMPQCTSRIKYLYFDKNSFTQDNVHILAALVHLCPYVDFLHCKCCNITSVDLQSLLSLLCQARRLPSADFCYVWKWLLTGNAIDDGGVYELIANLSHLFPRIAKIDTDDNPDVSSDMVAKLEQALVERRKCAKNWRVAEQLSSKVVAVSQAMISESSIPGHHCDERSWRKLVSSFILFVITHYCNTDIPLTIEAVTVDAQSDFKSQNITLPLQKNVFWTGLRVIRGPDWQSGDEDGGDGSVGSVMEISNTAMGGGKFVAVKWDCGRRGRYRCGVEGKFDLKIFDNLPTGLYHRYVACDSCNQHPLQGMRWKCIQCWDFDLCTSCYMTGKQSQTDSLRHTFMRYDTISQQVLRVQVPPRFETSMKVFQRATSFDLKSELHSKEGFHYTDHLPVLGYPYPQPTKMPILVKKDQNGELGYDFNEGVHWGYSGAIITYITPESAAAEALRVGDRILKVNGVSLIGKSLDEMKAILESLSDFDMIRHLIERDRNHIDNQDLTPHLQDEVDYPSGTPEPNVQPEESSDSDNGVITIISKGNKNPDRLTVNDLRTVRIAVWDVRAQWYNFGIELDITTPSLDAIQRNQHHVVEDCFTTMLKEWLRRVQPPPTWSTLVKALRSPTVNCPQLADDIRKEYC